MEEEFKISDYKPMINFKDLFFKVIKNWWLYLVFLLGCFFIAYQVNLRKKPLYSVGSQVVVSNDKNPFFSSNTNIAFNWGGASDKIQTTIVLFKSRTHNEKVVEYLQYYVNYEKQAKHWVYDAYKEVPILVEVDTSAYQMLNNNIVIKPIDDFKYELSYVLRTSSLQVQHYGTKRKKVIKVTPKEIKKVYAYGDIVESTGVKFKLHKTTDALLTNLDSFKVSFIDFDTAVKKYRGIGIRSIIAGSPIINLSMKGGNKNRIVDYLNASVKVLSRDQLARKNLFATKTIDFVDKMLDSLRLRVLNNEDELNSFYKKTKTMNLAGEGSKLSEKLTNLDVEKNALEKKYQYLKILEEYLLNKKEFADVPAPSIVGIDESNIVGNINKIIKLSVERSKYGYAVREDSPIFAELDRDVNSLKVVLYENIASYRTVLDLDKNEINKQLYKAESEFSELPEDQQKLGNIERQYNLSNNLYQLFLGKKSEAKMIKAASVSDLIVIDGAKASGVRATGPNKQINYIVAGVIGFLIPTLIVVLLFLLNTNITSVQDVEFLSKVPILGVIGKSSCVLTVFERSKSPVSESFRSIRSNLEFIYKKQKQKSSSKTILVTSSVSGEGKTFTAINIASLYAVGGKKTVLIGLDLRKPKIFGDFNLHNNFGVVNYLVKNKTLSEVIQKTDIPNLDLITSGPIPPNPSELLISSEMDDFVAELKEKYDYIVFDTPPLGLVTDALDLTRFSDANIYMIRQDYTKKGMLGLINEKYENKEISNISFVLNYFKTKTGYGYGYGYGYGVYGNGYHEVDVEVGLIKKVSNFLKKVTNK